jgi:hypothetical protein
MVFGCGPPGLRGLPHNERHPTVATAPHSAMTPLTNHVIGDKYGAERPLDSTGGSAGQTAQNR